MIWEYIPNMSKPKFCKCEEYNCFAWDDEKFKCKITEWKKPCPLIEIVTCGECKYFDYEYGWCKRPKKMSFIAEPTDFCSYGERNEDFDPYQGERDRDENGEIY